MGIYRYFPSKAKMFEALIEFTEDAVSGLINQVANNQDETLLFITS